MRALLSQILFFLLLILYAQKVTCQSVQGTVWKDSLATAVGTTFTNRLTLTNTSAQRQSVSLTSQIPKSVQLLANIPDKLILNPGEIRMIPIKGLINHQPTSAAGKFAIQVSDSIGHSLLVKSFYLIVSGKVQPTLSLYTREETVVLLTTSESAHLPLHLVHTGEQTAQFYLDVTSLPEGVDRTPFPLPVKLRPNQDTILSISTQPLRHWSTSEPYQIIVTVRDSHQSIIGSLVYKVVVAVAAKQYRDARWDASSRYGVSAAVSRFSTDEWARETRVWGADSIGKAQVDFHIHYLNYGANHFQQLQNSFVSVQTNQTMVRLGSLYDYHELPLFGRGLKAILTRPDHRWTLWAVNANPNWLSHDDNNWQGNVFSVRYDQQLATLPGGSWSVSSSYFTQSTTMRTGYLNFASFRYDQSERHSLQVLAGQSLELAQHRPDRAQTLGWAGQLNYNYQSPTLSWQLRSYASTPVYSGLQKGATLVYSQLFWRPSTATTLIARLNYLRYNRLLFTSATDSYHHVFGNAVAEVNLNHRIQQYSLSLRPYWFSQSDLANPVSQRADAYRVAPALSYHRRSNQHFELSYDVGVFYDRSAPSPAPGLLSQRLVSSVVMGPLSFWGYLQKGPYYLFDLRNDRPDQIMTASLTPMVDFTLLNRKLMGSIGLNYLYDATTAEARYIGVGRIQYDVTRNLLLRLSGNGTPYSQRPELAYSMYRLEVTKQFNELQSGKHGQLQLSFFEDANGNGSKETGERWMDSLLVSVNENTLITNAKGAIIYRNIPPGTYSISAISANRLGDPVLYQEKVTVARSVNKQIPLVLTFRVQGQLRCQSNVYDRQPCQFSRFIIDVQRDQKTIASTSPLPDGTFSVHLPAGPYTLVVHDYGRQQQATVKTISFTLTDTGQHPVFDWTVDASTRPVEVKRFKAD